MADAADGFAVVELDATLAGCFLTCPRPALGLEVAVRGTNIPPDVEAAVRTEDFLPTASSVIFNTFPPNSSGSGLKRSFPASYVAKRDHQNQRVA